jgi:hypothetical protein|tara:strand:- start:620 stop:823 length:204 start_codon:yes stop_codon:yes gene_type:complete
MNFAFKRNERARSFAPFKQQQQQQQREQRERVKQQTLSRLFASSFALLSASVMMMRRYSVTEYLLCV